ncbi:MAG: hypothetical protein ACRDTT_00475 [Pseudonocardiaceae bacterium]
MAHDNLGVYCAPCQTKSANSGPPEVPEDFWDADLIRDALKTWHMGRVIAAYRNHPFHGQPLRQEVVAGWVLMAQPQLSRLENGPPVKDLDKLVLWARTLRIPGSLLWFKLPEDANREPVRQNVQPPRSDSGVEFQDGAALESPGLLNNAHLVFLNPDETARLVHIRNNPRQVDRVALKSLATVLHEWRRLEDKIGAAPLLPSARAQLILFEHLVVEARGPLRLRVLLLGSQYAQFTAWLHSSDQQLDKAHTYYDRATEWSLEANDPNMVASVLSMKGTMAWHLNQLGPMLGLSEAAGRHTRASPGVRTLAIQQGARADALLGNGDSCDRKLDTATVLADRAAACPEREPPWVYFFSPDFLVMQRGLAYRYLGRYQQAEELLSAGLDALPPEIRKAEWVLKYERDLEAVRERL